MIPNVAKYFRDGLLGGNLKYQAKSSYARFAAHALVVCDCGAGLLHMNDGLWCYACDAYAYCDDTAGYLLGSPISRSVEMAARYNQLRTPLARYVKRYVA